MGFASFPVPEKAEFQVVFLALSPIENDNPQSVEEHIKFIFFLLGVFNTSFHNVSALIGSSYSTNPSIAYLHRMLLLWCAGHVFQLSVCESISENENVV